MTGTGSSPLVKNSKTIPSQPARAELSPPDTAFLNRVADWGVSQQNWDTGELAAVTLPNAYRFTRSYRITRGPGATAPVALKSADTPLDLTVLHAGAADGKLSLETLLRDRLKNHSLVVLKGDTLFHEHYWNGMTPASTHLEMSVTKSFVSILAAIAVTEGLIDMDASVTRYLPELKGTAFDGMMI